MRATNKKWRLIQMHNNACTQTTLPTTLGQPRYSLKTHVFEEQIRIFCRGYGWQLLANLAVATACLDLFAETIPQVWQLTWWGALTVSALSRYLPNNVLQANNGISFQDRYRRLLAAELADGILWGLLILAIPYPPGATNPPFLVAIIVGLVAGPIPFLSTMPRTFGAFTIPPQLALAWREWATDNKLMAVAIMGLLFVALGIARLSYFATRERILKHYRLQQLVRRSKRREATIHTLFEASPDMIGLLNAQGRWQIANTTTAHALGLHPVDLVNQNCEHLLNTIKEPTHRESLQKVMGSHINQTQNREELILRQPHQAPRTIDLIRSPLPEQAGGGWILVGRDITHQRRENLNRQLRDRLAQASLRGEALESALGPTLTAIAEHLDLLWLGILRLDTDGVPVGLAQGGRLHLDHETATALMIAPADPPHRLLYPLVHNKENYGFLACRPLLPHDLAADATVWLKQLAHDIAAACQLDAAQDRLRTLAHYDALTGLPNRALFLRLLNDTIALSTTEDGLHALLFLDLDRFKQINDSLGHAGGDLVLLEVTRRLNHIIRVNDVVARLSGDEYALLLRHASSVNDIEHILTRILTALRAPVRIGAEQTSTQASIGLTFIPFDETDAQGLLRHADLAMYEAKRQGRDRWCLFEPAFDLASRDHHALQIQLRTALEEGLFTLHYQPQIDLQTLAVVGVEALLRWSDPTMEPQSPDVFVPIAEESGLIIPLGEWVLREACAQQQRWMSEGITLQVAVNLSPTQFLDPGLPQRVEDALTAGGTHAKHIALEITERAAFADPIRAQTILNAWQDQGLQCAIDDFGTGHASLSYLTNLPAELIKIDRAFIAPLPDNTQHRTIVEGVIHMAHQLSRRVLAEGVETQAQLKWLTENGCDLAQGFAIAYPMPATDLQQWLDDWQTKQVPTLRALQYSAKTPTITPSKRQITYR